jgi:cyclic pyranopterin phosphate synthase
MAFAVDMDIVADMVTDTLLSETRDDAFAAPAESDDTFCAYPFTQMLFDPKGQVTPCCWNQDYVLGNIKEAKLEDLWNGERMQALRREFLSGKPVSCARQISEIRCHLQSRRPGAVVAREAVQQQPARFDVRLNGQCNLSCVMCDVWQMPNGTYDQTDFWARGPRDFFPYLEEMDVLGGEPLIQKDTYRLIDEITKVNAKCSFAFVTNGHYVLNEMILSYLERIPIRWISVSVDSVNAKTYESIRLKGRLDRVLDTVYRLREYRAQRLSSGRGFALSTTMCVQKQNWREVGDYLAWASTENVNPGLQFAYDPDSVSLLTLSARERQEILDWWAPLATTYPSDVLHPIVSALTNSLK